MTLTEYLSQNDPIRMPNVILAEGEYKRGLKIQLSNNESITQIFIPAINTYYIQKNDGTMLFTCDNDGNPKDKSCFNLDGKTIKREEIENCPKEATHVKFNPSGEFIEMFYKVSGDSIQYLSFAKIWFFSDSAEKDKNFISKLTPIQ